MDCKPLAMTQLHLPISFFLQIGDPSNPGGIEAAWRRLSFPLIKTKDFDHNWVKASGGWNIFQDESGQRCSVKPLPKLASKFPGVEETSLYPSIVFSKIIYWKSQLAGHNGRLVGAENSVIRRRIFADFYLNYLPTDWKATVLKYDLHHYPEKVVDESKVPKVLCVPLSKASNFRLLVVLPCPPGRTHVDIECLLGEEDFELNRPYEALSYVWGDSTNKKTIWVNENSVSVTANLENALRALRKTNSELRVLWVDALCINQNDNEEKGIQVARMDVVYKRAKRVLVWLGNETLSSRNVFDYLEDIKKLFFFGSDDVPDWFPVHFPFNHEEYDAQCAKTLQRQFSTSNVLQTHPKWSRIYENSELSSFERRLRVTVPPEEYLWSECLVKILEDFTEVLSRPWWQRVWAIQEMVLASEAKILCGQQLVDWSLFRAVLMLLVQIGQKSHMGQAPPNTLRRRKLQAFSNLTNKTIEILPFILMWGVDKSSSAPVKSFKPSLPNLLTLSSNFRATDRRDHIFALRGILKESDEYRKQIIPNYTKPVEIIYLELARDHINRSGTLDVLSALNSEATVSSTLNLPSWVPDWSSRNSFLPSTNISLTEFSAHIALKTLSQKQHKAIGKTVLPKEYGENLGFGKDDHDESLGKQPELIDDAFCATGRQKAIISYEFSQFKDNQVLRARGILVDEVEAVGLCLNPHFILEPMRQSMRQHYVDTFDNWKTLCDPSETTSYMETGQSRNEAFWRTLMMNRYWKREDLSTEIRDVIKFLPEDLRTMKMTEVFGNFSPIPATFPPKTEIDEEHFRLYLHHSDTRREVYNRYPCHCRGYAAFRTKLGYIGLCQPSVYKEDVVTILSGCKVPLVLRKYENHYVFMGECYVHGVMNGEFFERNGPDGNGGKADYEVFDLI